MAPVAQEPEIVLAQRLASNEKPVRTNALKALRKYINLRSQHIEGGFTSEDLLKIWKGLFYCLWMQDKPLLQEELSDRISGLTQSFHTTDSQLLYFESFLQTLKREWNGIDRLRMDKFFQLVRFMFRQIFVLLKKNNWDLSVVNKFLEVFTVQLLQTTDHVPNGMMLHILDLYMTELASVGADELTAKQNLTFIDPFCKTMAKTKDRLLLISISKNIFRTIIDQAPFAIEDLIKELQQGKAEDSDSGQASEDEEEIELQEEWKSKASKMSKGKKVNGISEVKEDIKEDSEDDLGLNDDDNLEAEEIGPVLQFDYSEIAERLFELASRSNTRNFNRTKMYSLVKIYRNLKEGIFPQDQQQEEDDLSDSSDDELFPENKKKKKKKKRKHLKKMNEEETSTKDTKDQNETLNDTTENIKKTKKSKKKRAGHDQTAECTPELDSQTPTETSQDQKKKPDESTQLESLPEDDSELHQKCHNQLQTAKRVNGAPVLQNNRADPQSQLEASCAGKKKRKSKKLELSLTEVESECPLVSDKDLGSKSDREVIKQDGAERVKAKASEEVVAASTTTKKQKKSKKLCSISEEIKKLVESECQDSCVDSLETPADEPTSISVKKNKKKKKSKFLVDVEVTESSAGLKAAASSKPTVVDEADVGKSSEPKPVKKAKKKKKSVSLIEPESELETEERTVLEAAPTTQTAMLEQPPCTPTPKKRKKTQKNQAMTFAQSLVNGVCQPTEATESPVPKSKSTKKQKAAAEEQIAELPDKLCESTVDCSSLNHVKTAKKKRKMQTEEAGTAQSDGQTKKKISKQKDVEVSILVTPKKKLKMDKEKAKSDLITFQGLVKPPTPLFCKTKPKSSPSTPLTGIKKFQTPTSETKKVTFGLRNNKTAEFRKTDKSLSVSPVGPSRVAFDPKKRPASGVLKSPMVSPAVKRNKTAPKRRATAADFF
ncbi:ribosomal RNA processing protein 1 homolog B-like [Trichomycterus rosablanca]|uniref:ribosomal RNA processing protein 1 homolog B-like n=1 Tax=Trichomycterus rosablanca TaxID=2290929 RepID=UPI002F354787